MTTTILQEKMTVVLVNTVEIEICERLMDYWIDYDNNGKRMPKYHAQIKGKPGIWACGRHPHDAIGDLIAHHPEAFGIKITMLEGKLPR